MWVIKNESITFQDDGWHINDSEMIELSEILQYNTFITSIELGEHHIDGVAGFTALMAALKINTSVTSIYCASSSFTGADMYALADVLQVNSSIVHLSIKAEQIVNGVGVFANVLINNSTLSSLEFDVLHMTDIQVGTLCDALKTNTSLTHITFSHQQNSDVIALADALTINSTITTIELWLNYVYCNGIYTLLTTVAAHTCIDSLHLFNSDATVQANTPTGLYYKRTTLGHHQFMRFQPSSISSCVLFHGLCTCS